MPETPPVTVYPMLQATPWTQGDGVAACIDTVLAGGELTTTKFAEVAAIAALSLISTVYPVAVANVLVVALDTSYDPSLISVDDKITSETPFLFNVRINGVTSVPVEAHSIVYMLPVVHFVVTDGDTTVMDGVSSNASERMLFTFTSLTSSIRTEYAPGANEIGMVHTYGEVEADATMTPLLVPLEYIIFTFDTRPCMVNLMLHVLPIIHFAGSVLSIEICDGKCTEKVPELVAVIPPPPVLSTWMVYPACAKIEVV
jgi:hypothetical protein